MIVPPTATVRCNGIELRLASPRHARQLFRLASEPRVSMFLDWQAHVDPEQTLAYLADARRLWLAQTAYLFGIFESESDQILGATGISNIDRVHLQGEVGTWLGLPHQQQGLNLAVKAAIFTFAFEVLGLQRLEMVIRADNAGSIAATRKLPSVHDEGLMRERLLQDGSRHDAVGYAVLASQFDGYPPAEISQI